MSVLSIVERVFDRFLPSPFTIAVLLSLLSMVLALIFTNTDIPSLLSDWQNGMWDTNLLVFAYQMMLILILGHILVLSPPIKRLIELSLVHLKNPTNAIIFTAASTMLLAFFNWGLSLIYGALLARNIGEQAAKHKIAINYPLLGAAGYSGLMLWHGGLSGSAPLKAAESGHLKSMAPNLQELQLPEVLKTSETVLSFENLVIFIGCFMLVLGCFWLLSTRTARSIPHDLEAEKPEQNQARLHPLESKAFLPKLFGVILLLAFWFSYSADIANG
ncbi:MAG: TIGR00366 family protein, partial [Flavobacteriaceae bacterium]|nr:TIGR00366 family protein [Flavobacteriaceae bacterium]